MAKKALLAAIFPLLLGFFGCQGDYILDETYYPEQSQLVGDPKLDGQIVIRSWGKRGSKTASDVYNHPSPKAAALFPGVLQDIGCDTAGRVEPTVLPGHIVPYQRVKKFYEKGGQRKFMTGDNAIFIGRHVAKVLETMNSSQNCYFRYGGYNVYVWVAGDELKILFRVANPDEDRSFHPDNPLMIYKLK